MAFIWHTKSRWHRMSTRFSKPILLANAVALSLLGSIASAITVSLNDTDPSAGELSPINVTSKPVGSAANTGAYEFSMICCQGPLKSLVAVHLDPGHLP